MDEQRHAKTGGLQVIDTLSQMFVSKPVHALQFHDNFLVNQQIGTVFAHTLPLVADWKRSLIFLALTPRSVSSRNMARS
jgi:hypothetical protein